MSGLTPRTVGVIEFSAAMVLSGTLGIFVLESGQSAWNVVFFRCLFGAASLFVYCGIRGFLTPSAFTRLNLLLALGGGVAIVANWVLLFSAYQFGSISVATAVYHTQPFFLILLGALFLGDRPGIGKIAWIVLAFCGLLLVIEARELSLDLGSGDMLGALLAVGAAVLYAIATLMTKQLKGVRPHLIALVQVSLGTVLLLPFSDFGAVAGWGPHWLYLAALGLIHTCFMYILLYSGIQKLAVPPIAVLSFLYPIVAILVDYGFYDRRLTTEQMVGIGLILLGSAGVNLNWTLRLPWALARAPARPAREPGSGASAR